MASPRPSGFARSCPALFLRQVGRQRAEGWMGAGLLAPFARVAQRVEQGRRVADAVTSWWTVDTGRAELSWRTVDTAVSRRCDLEGVVQPEQDVVDPIGRPRVDVQRQPTRHDAPVWSWPELAASDLVADVFDVAAQLVLDGEVRD